MTEVVAVRRIRVALQGALMGLELIRHALVVLDTFHVKVELTLELLLLHIRLVKALFAGVEDCLALRLSEHLHALLVLLIRGSRITLEVSMVSEFETSCMRMTLLRPDLG